MPFVAVCKWMLLNQNEFMKQKIAHIALVVNFYCEAIKFYAQKRNFKLVEDTKIEWKQTMDIDSATGSKRMLSVIGEGY